MAERLFHPEAQDEYSEALVWYRKRSLRAAQGFEAEVERVLELIAQRPELFPLYDADHRIAILRKYPYSLIYLQLHCDVYIIAVAHSSRRPDYWQGRTIEGA